MESTWVHPETLKCAEQLCVPCLYKLFPNGAKEFNFALPPNQRPEMCRRAGADRPYYGLYQSQQGGKRGNKPAILIVGDGDFSYSLSVARGLLPADRVCILATSHESRASVLATYTRGAEILQELESLLPSGHLLHEVDATSLSVTPLIDAQRGKLAYIIWNFPCVGPSAGRGADGQVQEIEENKQLLRAFFQNAREYLNAQGEIHVTHKTIEPFSWWGIIELAQSSGLKFVGSIIFDRCLYPGYTNRKVKDNKSFPLHDARTFIFRAIAVGEPPCQTSLCKPRAVDEVGMRSMGDPATIAALAAKMILYPIAAGKKRPAAALISSSPSNSKFKRK